jgi:hypothetical protein
MERPAPFCSNKCVGHPRWRGRSHIRKEPAASSQAPGRCLRGATNVTLDSITVQQYATGRQHGAINPDQAASGWVVRNISAVRNYWAGLNCPVSELWRRISASAIAWPSRGPHLGFAPWSSGQWGPLGVVVVEIAVEIEA